MTSSTRRLATGWCLLILAVVYFSLAIPFSLLTRAYEADDESAHVQYIEHIVGTGSIPVISVADGGESHQPPLYYLLEAGWQRLLNLPPFVPRTSLAQHIRPDTLVLNHDYTVQERREAGEVHELRLLSVILGFGTVLCTYASACVLNLRRAIAVSAALFVALLPRELVMASDVTNDALIIPLCALAMLLFLLAERARSGGYPVRRRWHLVGMGAVLGLGAITKFTALPVAGVLLVIASVPMLRRTPAAEADGGDLQPGMQRTHWHLDLRSVTDIVLAAAAFLATSGWWFIRNKHLYGQFLATKRSEGYLINFLAHPVPWSWHIILVQVPWYLLETTWYQQPNLSLPLWTNWALAAVGVLTLVVGARRMMSKSSEGPSRAIPLLSGVALVATVVSGFVAMVINVKTTSLSDARILFVALAPIAILATVGVVHVAQRFGGWLRPWGPAIWPTVLLATDLYVVVRYLVPLGGL